MNKVRMGALIPNAEISPEGVNILAELRVGRMAREVVENLAHLVTMTDEEAGKRLELDLIIITPDELKSFRGQLAALEAENAAMRGRLETFEFMQAVLDGKTSLVAPQGDAQISAAINSSQIDSEPGQECEYMMGEGE